MGPATARRAICDALRAPLQVAGWRSRASGWWTRDLTPEWVAVVVAGTTGAGHAAGQGYAHMYIGVRHPALEESVARLCGYRDTYQNRTVVNDLATLMRRHPGWLVTPDSAPRVATQMATEVDTLALPHLQSLAADDETVLRNTHSRRLWSAPDACRHALAAAEFRGVDAASDAIAEILQSIAGRTDPAVDDTRTYLGLLQQQISAPDPH